jgi:hypothetical protein
VVGPQRSNADSGDHPGIDAPRYGDDGAAASEPPDGLSRSLGDAFEAGGDVELLRSGAV